MKDKNIYYLWTEFITDNKYKKYMIINLKKLWMNKLDDVKQYIDKIKRFIIYGLNL